MQTFLLDHLEGCTPLQPCASCDAVAFLRGKLSADDFATLIEKTKGVKNPSEEGVIALDASIDVLQMTNRPTNGLKSEKIYTIGDLVKKTEDEIRRIPNIGRRSFYEIVEKLALIGRHLGEVNP